LVNRWRQNVYDNDYNDDDDDDYKTGYKVREYFGCVRIQFKLNLTLIITMRILLQCEDRVVDNIKMDLKQDVKVLTGFATRDANKRWVFLKTIMNFRVPR
jgi:hypothetical protein